jgi:hypothetical protein
MNMILTNKGVLKIIKNLGILMIVVIIITLLYSSPEIHYKNILVTLYYCVPINKNEPREHQPHPSEEELISVFEIAGTYYGEAIGEELVYNYSDL